MWLAGAMRRGCWVDGPEALQLPLEHMAFCAAF